jgi:3-oxoacyl-[acyl-carrier protein] reductase
MESLREMREGFGGAGRLCLFGVGVLLENCLRQFKLSLGREPDFLCDNDPGKWGRLFHGVPCISPSELERLKDGMAVIITVRRYEGIAKQLLALGMKDVFVSCYARGYDILDGFRRLDEGAQPPLEECVPLSVRGRWTFITGASRGLGRLIAREMARLGSNIIAHGRTLQHLEGVVGECSSFGVQALPVAAELSDFEELDAMIASLDGMAPQIDILFNNAGVSLPYPNGFWKVEPETFVRTYAVNTVAPIRICQTLIPKMMARGFGRVVNMSSSIEKRPLEMAYACSKSALSKFVHDLAPTLQGSGVMMSCADPGWLRTDMGGADAPCAPESAIPGVLLGVLADADVNGRWFSAQDYSGMTLEQAIRKAKFVCLSGGTQLKPSLEKAV